MVERSPERWKAWCEVGEHGTPEQAGVGRDVLSCAARMGVPAPVVEWRKPHLAKGRACVFEWAHANRRVRAAVAPDGALRVTAYVVRGASWAPTSQGHTLSIVRLRLRWVYGLQRPQKRPYGVGRTPQPRGRRVTAWRAWKAVRGAPAPQRASVEAALREAGERMWPAPAVWWDGSTVVLRWWREAAMDIAIAPDGSMAAQERAPM